MATIETGFFFILLFFAFVFTFFSFKTVGNIKSIFFMVSMAVWTGLSVMMAAGFEVSSKVIGGTEIVRNGTGAIIQNITKADSKNVFLANGDQTGVLSWIFMGLAILCFILFVKVVWKAE